MSDLHAAVMLDMSVASQTSDSYLEVEDVGSVDMMDFMADSFRPLRMIWALPFV